MILCNESVQLHISADGGQIELTDLARRQCWRLDSRSLVCEIPGPSPGAEPVRGCLSPLSAAQSGPERVEITYGFAGRVVVVRYALIPGGVEATLLAGRSEPFFSVALPGSFEPGPAAEPTTTTSTSSVMKKYLLPLLQGMFWNPCRGEPFEQRYSLGGHTGFSMAMVGCLGDRGGLLCVTETYDDCRWLVGKDAAGRSYVTPMQEASLGQWRHDRAVRLYVTEPTITAVAKRYRARMIEKGRFKSWREKITERPAVKRLAGAIMCFIGYCQDDLDYVRECGKLKALGFDRALVYPVRFNAPRTDFRMGGFPPIHLDAEQVRQIKALGYDVAPWTWITQSLGDGSDDGSSNGELIRLRRDAQGRSSLMWQMDGQQFYTNCSALLQEHQRRANRDGATRDTTWNHFDVLVTAHNGECHATDHPDHLGRAMGRSEDREFIRKVLLQDQADGRIVSSEGFVDAYSMEYDIGSTKAWPVYGHTATYWPIPLTGLVYHDSMEHSWWEVHNYNDAHFGWDFGQYRYGGGQPRLMAAMDALYGSMPHVFPFGAQYCWTKWMKETFLYRMRLEDPLTQYALQLAKPVTQLHAEIGMLEMTDFAILSEDGYVQRTTFENGVEVYANFGPGPAVSTPIDGLGELQPESWAAKRG